MIVMVNERVNRTQHRRQLYQPWLILMMRWKKAIHQLTDCTNMTLDQSQESIAKDNAPIWSVCQP